MHTLNFVALFAVSASFLAHSAHVPTGDDLCKVNAVTMNPLLTDRYIPPNRFYYIFRRTLLCKPSVMGPSDIAELAPVRMALEATCAQNPENSDQRKIMWAIAEPLLGRFLVKKGEALSRWDVWSAICKVFHAIKSCTDLDTLAKELVTEVSREADRKDNGYDLVRANQANATTVFKNQLTAIKEKFTTLNNFFGPKFFFDPSMNSWVNWANPIDHINTLFLKTALINKNWQLFKQKCANEATAQETDLQIVLNHLQWGVAAEVEASNTALNEYEARLKAAWDDCKARPGTAATGADPGVPGTAAPPPPVGPPPPLDAPPLRPVVAVSTKGITQALLLIVFGVLLMAASAVIYFVYDMRDTEAWEHID